MFSRSKCFFFVLIFLQANIEINTEDVDNIDNVVRDCRNKERRFADMEDNYVDTTPRPPSEPTLSGPPFPAQARQIYLFELSQRKFECIADELHIYSNDPELYSSRKYRSLVHQCKNKRPITLKCDPSSPYRSINGTCNNLLHPNLGRMYGCFRRFLPANYEGVSGFRKSVKDNSPLPNARNISRVLVKPVIRRTKEFNALFAFFGQAIAHDLAQFPFSLVNGTGNIQCCSDSSEEDLHPQCAPIYIDPNDPFYSKHDVTCVNFVRVAPCITCSVEKRVPINAVTGWLDCSLVYGSTDDKAQEIRRNDGSGKLLSQERNSREILPADPSRGPSCGNIEKEEFCFESGDNRVNQNTPLMMFQTLLLEEHNRIAGVLKDMNPDWDEEQLYQESRKILIAEWHVIIYKEYLPVLLGPKLMEKRGLNINSQGTYDPSVNPTLTVEFNGAAFRVHSTLPSVAVHNEDDVYLRFLFVNAMPVYHDKMSKFLFNMAHTDAEEYDWFMPRDVTNFLYKRIYGTWGYDLPALDIQRGRDVGLPTYVQIIERLKNRRKKIESFDDLSPYIHDECIEIIQKLYGDVRDVDFFVGIMCEKIPDDLIISPTAAHFIADQFKRLKYGDRFYVEFDDTLTDDQRQTLMNASLARFICDNTKVDSFQPNAFRFPSERNPLQPCSSIPGVDLSKWNESTQK